MSLVLWSRCYCSTSDSSRTIVTDDVVSLRNYHLCRKEREGTGGGGSRFKVKINSTYLAICSVYCPPDKVVIYDLFFLFRMVCYRLKSFQAILMLIIYYGVRRGWMVEMSCACPSCRIERTQCHPCHFFLVRINAEKAVYFWLQLKLARTAAMTTLGSSNSTRQTYPRYVYNLVPLFESIKISFPITCDFY